MKLIPLGFWWIFSSAMYKINARWKVHEAMWKRNLEGVEPGFRRSLSGWGRGKRRLIVSKLRGDFPSRRENWKKKNMCICLFSFQTRSWRAREVADGKVRSFETTAASPSVRSLNFLRLNRSSGGWYGVSSPYFRLHARGKVRPFLPWLCECDGVIGGSLVAMSWKLKLQLLAGLKFFFLLDELSHRNFAFGRNLCFRK